MTFSQAAKIIFRHTTSMIHLLPTCATSSQSIEMHIFPILTAASKRAPLSIIPSPSFGLPVLTQELSMWHRYHVASFRAKASSLSCLPSTVLRLCGFDACNDSGPRDASFGVALLPIVPSVVLVGYNDSNARIDSNAMRSLMPAVYSK